MELADLVPAERRLRTMRAALHFVVLGAVLLVARVALPRVLPHARASIEVVVPSMADEALLATRIDEAILVEEGLRFGWAESDPIIRRRLALNMAFADGTSLPESDAAIDEASVEEALALGMHRTDPVVRGRIVTRVRQILATPSPEELPDDATLAAHLEANADRFALPARVAFVHVMLRADARAATLEGDAEALLARLRAEGVGPELAPSLGDSSPLLSPTQRGSIAGIDRLFGRGFGGAIAPLPVGEWSGPVASSYGLHLVRVESREVARVPPLEVVRSRVLADYLDATRSSRIARRLEELRERYSVRVVRRGGSS